MAEYKTAQAQAMGFDQHNGVSGPDNAALNAAAKEALEAFLKTIRESEGVPVYASASPKHATGDVSDLRVCRITRNGVTINAVHITYCKCDLIDGALGFYNTGTEDVSVYIGTKN